MGAVALVLTLSLVVFAQAKEEAKVIFDFENAGDAGDWELASADASIVPDHATSGKTAMKVVLKPGNDYPGLNTAKAPADWSAYKSLKVDVFCDEAMNFMIRIDDTDSKDYASRYNLDSNDINKGANTVTIPLSDVGAKIDLKKVKLLIFFSGKVEKDTTYYLDNIRLVK
jgi:hypothetical protein